jgi:hypothetical protein
MLNYIIQPYKAAYNFTKNVINDAINLFNPKKKNKKRSKPVDKKYLEQEINFKTMDEFFEAFIKTRSDIINQALTDNLILMGISPEEPDKVNFEYLCDDNVVKFTEKTFNDAMHSFGFYDESDSLINNLDFADTDLESTDTGEYFDENLATTYNPLTNLSNRQLTKDFTLYQFINSATARAKGINNDPDQQALNNIIEMAKIVQIIQNELGMRINVNSCFRCPKLNSAVGGATNSDHKYGAAVDIKVIPFSLENNMKLWKCVNRLADEGKIKFRQLIFEYGNRNIGPKWVHVSINHPNNKQKNNQRVYVS